jgi:Mg2+ and Co2+ transporter CorA
MKPSELLKQIQTLLSVEAKVELAQMTTADGVVLEAEAFEVGRDIFIVSETETVPADNGEYKVDDKTIIVMDGKIESILEAETEIEVEAAEEVKEEVKVEAVSQEEIIKAVIEAVAPMLEEMKSQIEEMKSEMKNNKETKMAKVTHSPEKVAQVEKPKSNFNKQTNVLETIFAKLN